MGLIRRMQIEARATAGTIGNPGDPALAAWFGVGSMTAAGASVTPESAKSVGGVYACVRYLSEIGAAIPLLVMKKMPRGDERDPSHPLWPLLHDKPNRRQTSFEWREMMIGHLCLRGNAYSQILQNNAGAVTELLPMHPDRTVPFLAPDGRVAYRYQPPVGEQIILLDTEVLHLRGWSEDGVIGLSPIAAHKETVGRSMAMREYGSKLFGNNATPKGGVKVPAVLGPEAATKLRESWEARHKGSENAGKIAIFDGGMEWMNIGMTNDDAQYIESLKFDIEEIARIYRVPPHKIGHLERSTNNNIEHQAIEVVGDTHFPLARRFESRMNTTLLSEAGQKTHVIVFELKGLMRGDATARSNFYRGLFNVGAMSPNQILRLEDMETYEGGDEHYVPLNMAPVSRQMDVLLKQPAAPTDAPTPDQPDEETPTRMNGHAGH